MGEEICTSLCEEFEELADALTASAAVQFSVTAAVVDSIADWLIDEGDGLIRPILEVLIWLVVVALILAAAGVAYLGIQSGAAIAVVVAAAALLAGIGNLPA